ncbi:hypothetical protein HGB13_01155 [bacterium]|nr:hypothetical protein [bacterium]
MPKDETLTADQDELSAEAPITDFEIEDIAQEEAEDIFDRMKAEGLDELDLSPDSTTLEFMGDDIAIQGLKDLRVKALSSVLSNREVHFIIHYYEHYNQIRSIVMDFEDALEENLIAIGRELIRYPHCYIWATNEMRTHLKRQGVDFVITDIELITAAFNYEKAGKPNQIEELISRFRESKTLDKKPLFKASTIDILIELVDYITKSSKSPNKQTS